MTVGRSSMADPRGSRPHGTGPSRRVDGGGGPHERPPRPHPSRDADRGDRAGFARNRPHVDSGLLRRPLRRAGARRQPRPARNRAGRPHAALVDRPNQRTRVPRDRGGADLGLGRLDDRVRHPDGGHCGADRSPPTRRLAHLPSRDRTGTGDGRRRPARSPRPCGRRDRRGRARPQTRRDAGRTRTHSRALRPDLDPRLRAAARRDDRRLRRGIALCDRCAERGTHRAAPDLVHRQWPQLRRRPASQRGRGGRSGAVHRGDPDAPRPGDRQRAPASLPQPLRRVRKRIRRLQHRQPAGESAIPTPRTQRRRVVSRHGPERELLATHGARPVRRHDVEPGRRRPGSVGHPSGRRATA